MARVLSHIADLRMILGICFVFFSETGFAQRISFNTWTGSDDITILSPQGAMPTLDFNQKQRALVPGIGAVTIGLVDNQAVIYEIEAPEGFDLTVDISAPSAFVLAENPTESIPFLLKVAYNNMAPTDELSGKLSAVELPAGFYSITFPVSRRTSGAPIAPPSPEDGAFTRPKAKAYLYLYGTLGPVGMVPAGIYEGEININVSFTSYD